eukprot:CAMPEP_0171309886 /NCGR_PEP_ID=MMETSP0816-20121228/20082_1 /TAXON_ID=420281 /ORGANISM="Proboscia inermis, Strain CCAP1064/1" /LENGTH=79 /DNA_ID=CAMNT_0011793711 /DNA_START=65 /DNA_END=301 /DNA_ORIENTATION=+
MNSHPGDPDAMPDDDKYLFDLNGYILIKNVLTPEEVLAANHAIDTRTDQFHERTNPTLRNASGGIGSPMYGTGPGRKDL